MFDSIDPSMVGTSTAILVFAGILSFLWLGRRLGRAALERLSGLPGTESLETAVFALLGLLIAFTFSGAVERFDARRIQVVNEANAIGTAYLRIELLPASVQAPLRDKFRQYADARIGAYRKLPDLKAARSELERSQGLQAEIWSLAVVAVRSPDSAAGTNVLVLPALNEMFDVATVRLAATQMHPPAIIFLMLVGLAFASALLAGYRSSGDKAHGWLHQLGFASIVAFTVFVILDMEYPRLGFIRVDAIDEVLVGVRAGMK